MLKKENLRGFSLIELLIAITIIGLISGLGITFSSSLQKNTRDTQRQADLQVLRSALQQFYADQNYYPDDLTGVLSSGASLTNCSGMPSGCTISKNYLSNVPIDPQAPTVKYCYTSARTATNFTACSGATSGKCQFYELCAKLENGSGTANCTCNASGNYRLTPL